MKCKTCYNWKNRLDIPYNRIHDEVKQCLMGYIVAADTRACHLHMENKPKLKRRAKPDA